MRIASYNVDNLFERAKALNLGDWKQGEPIVAAHAEINSLLQKEIYTDAMKARILELLGVLGLLHGDESTYARLCVSTGKLLRRPKAAPVEVVATGRASWVGWVELITAPVDEMSRQHTAMVIRDIKADVLGVVEADSRPALKRFCDTMLPLVHGAAYGHVMLFDGRDERGIDVGIVTRTGYTVGPVRTHIYDNDEEGAIFSRDCCEYHLTTPGGHDLVVLANHFKSKGYGSSSDPAGAHRRWRQATRVAEIYEDLRARGHDFVVVLGDLNDSPDSEALKPLLAGTDLIDISAHPKFEFGPRRGTFKGENEQSKFDYVLLSPALYARATGGAVLRTGVWHGPGMKDPWEIYPTMTSEAKAASDHAAIYADIAL